MNIKSLCLWFYPHVKQIATELGVSHCWVPIQQPMQRGWNQWNLLGAGQNSDGVDTGRMPDVLSANKDSSSTLHFVCLSSLVKLETQVNETFSSTFSKSSKSLEAFPPYFPPYYVYCNLQKNIRHSKSNEQSQQLLNLNSYFTFIWHITRCNIQQYYIFIVCVCV